MKWQTLETTEQVAQWLAQPQAVLFFKHSARCPICVFALQALERAWQDQDYTQIQPCIVHVRQARAASDYLTAQLDVTHASPQALLVRQNQVLYADSHESIQYTAILNALKKPKST